MEFKDTLKSLMEKNNVTPYRIGEDTAVSKQSVMKYLDGTKPSVDNLIELSKYFGVSTDQLLKGDEYTVDKVQKIHNPPYREAIEEEGEVTLYNIDSAANLVTLFDSDKTQNALGTLRIPNLPKCDGAVYVRGDSMYPLLKSGDIVAYKRVFNFESVVFGEMYLVDYSLNGDDFLVAKYVNKSNVDGCIKLVSYNPNHPPMDIRIEYIRAMALIKASVRFNTMI